MPVCRDPILSLLPSKPPDRPTDIITPAHEPLNIEDEPIDVDAIEPNLNMDFDGKSTQQEGNIHEVYKRLG